MKNTALILVLLTFCLAANAATPPATVTAPTAVPAAGTPETGSQVPPTGSASGVSAGAAAPTTLAPADVGAEFEALGGNEILLEKAKLLEPDQNISVVQNRLVDRTKRAEINLGFNSVVGGDSYLTSRAISGALNFHFTPRWSIGARYSYFTNDLTDEAKNLIYKDNIIPDVDHPKQEYMGLINWYPIYGKFSLYDLGIVHFDIYLLAGYGQIDLRYGAKSTYNLGAGAGFWIARNWSTRFEARHQHYTAQNYLGPSDRNLTVLSLSMGYFL